MDGYLFALRIIQGGLILTGCKAQSTILRDRNRVGFPTNAESRRCQTLLDKASDCIFPNNRWNTGREYGRIIGPKGYDMIDIPSFGNCTRPLFVNFQDSCALFIQISSTSREYH